MACSSYCYFTVKLKNKNEIEWAGEDGFSPIFFIPKKAKEQLKAIQSVEDLIKFVQACIAADEDDLDEEEAAEIYETQCGEFDAELRAIENIEDVSSLEFSWGQYDPEDGDPEDACTGQSLSYNFTTGAAKVRRKATKDFIAEMEDIYGDMLEYDE